MKYKISIIAMHHCNAGVLMGIVDIFKSANVILKHISNSDDDLFEVRIVSIDGESVKCSNSYTISVDGNLDLTKDDDVVICLSFSMASADEFIRALERWQPLTFWLKNNANSFDLIVGTGGGVFLLAEAGLLDDKTATTAWWFDQVFKQRYPAIKVDEKLIYVEQGNTLCAGANNSWQIASLVVIEKYAGRDFAKTISRYMMIDYERRSLAPDLFISQVHTDNRIVNKADVWIQKNLSQDIRIEDIANYVSVSPRTLVRHFQLALGESPLSYVQKARIEKCKLLLRISDMTFTEIVYRCGYKDTSTLRRLFKKHNLETPSAYRQKFRGD